MILVNCPKICNVRVNFPNIKHINYLVVHGNIEITPTNKHKNLFQLLQYFIQFNLKQDQRIKSRMILLTSKKENTLQFCLLAM